MLVGAVLALTGVLVFRIQPPPGRDAIRFYSARVKPRLMHMHAPLKTTALQILVGQHKGVALRFPTLDINSPAAAGVNCQEEGGNEAVVEIYDVHSGGSGRAHGAIRGYGGYFPA